MPHEVRQLHLGRTAQFHIASPAPGYRRVVPINGAVLASPARPLSAILEVGLEVNRDDVALTSADGSMTWRELDDASTALAAGYLGLGLRRGDRLASLMPNRPALVVHYLACFKAGLVATPLNYRYAPPEIDHALEVSGAAGLVAHAERADDVADSRLAADLACGGIPAPSVRAAHRADDDPGGADSVGARARLQRRRLRVAPCMPRRSRQGVVGAAGGVRTSRQVSDRRGVRDDRGWTCDLEPGVRCHQTRLHWPPRPGVQRLDPRPGGAEVPAGAIGRVLVQSPCGMIGDWEEPIATSP